MKNKMTKEEWEAEVEATVALLENKMPEGVPEKLEERGLLGSDVLVYGVSYIYDPLEERKRKMVRVKCTACGEETHLEQVPLGEGCFAARPPAPYGFTDPYTKDTVWHGLDCLCPSCGKGVTAVYTGRFKYTYEIESIVCLTLHNIRGHLALLAYNVTRLCDKECRTSYIGRGVEGMLMIDGRAVRVNACRRNMFTGVSWFPRWERRARFDNELGDWVTDEIINPDISLIEQTSCTHSALGEYMADAKKISPVSYLLLWNKYPNIENLVRSGCVGIVSDIIDKCEGYSYSYGHKSLDKEKIKELINISAVKPHEMLGIDKDEMHIARSYSLEVLNFYKWAKAEKGIRLSTELLDELKNIKIPALKEMMQLKWGRFSPKLLRTMNYLIKERKVIGSLSDVKYLGDYWDMLHKVYRRMPEELIYPKDLKRAHDEVMLRIKEKENKGLTRKIKERFASLDALSYSSEALGLLIRPAASQAELITEGKILNHCVARYAQSHASGKTSIFFIRHTSDPEMPFFTLEFKNGKVEQNRGAHNCARTDEVIAFEAEWLNYIRNLKEICI